MSYLKPQKPTILAVGLMLSFLSPSFSQQTISQVRILPLGSVVTTTGTLASGPEFGDVRYLQDDSAGIAVFSSSLSSTITGDSIMLTGVLSKYRGALQVSPVFSFTLVAKGKQTQVIEASALEEISASAFESRKVTLKCMGIATCEDVLDEGSYRLYDDQGEISRLRIQGDSLEGMAVPGAPVTITGIWTRFEDQYELRAQHITDASEANCHFMPAGAYYYSGNNPVLMWDGIPSVETILWTGPDSFTTPIPLGIPEGMVRVELDTILPGQVLKARLEQVDTTGQRFYSIPVFYSSSPSAGPIEVMFNRNVDAQYSDGSQPLGAGISFIENDIVSRIDEVLYSLDVAMYNTGREAIVEAIRRAVARGVKVRYIADDETSNSALDGVLPFPVKYRSGDGIMHHKFVVGDAESLQNYWVWTGSTNFSTNQLRQDPNHAIVIRDRALARSYSLEFDEIWGGQDSTFTMGRYGDFKIDNSAHLFKHGETLMESYFSPSDETNCHILDALGSADHHVQVGLLLLTKEDLTGQLIALHQAGVDVRVILEDEDSSEEALARLRAEGIQVRIHDLPSIFHHKYAIIDEGYPDSDPQVISGSHNWTWSADHINDENTLILHDQSVANIFRQEFEARWAELNPASTSAHNDIRLEVYPNPASGFIRVAGTHGNTFEAVLMDMTGRTVLHASLDAQEANTIYLPDDLPPGPYLLRCMGSGSQVTIRIIKQ